jgi:hypothetical protein
VLYVIRTLVQDDIPFNVGHMKSQEIKIPDDSMLKPRYPAPRCGQLRSLPPFGINDELHSNRLVVINDDTKSIHPSDSSQQLFNPCIENFQTYFFTITFLLIGRIFVQNPAFMLRRAINDIAHYHTLGIPV